MFAYGFVAILGLALNPGQADLLSIVDPEMGLTILGEKTNTIALRRLAKGEAPAPTPALSSDDARKAERQIQNLASSLGSVRERAEAYLASLGPSILPRLREVAASDPRRADAAKGVIAQIEAAEKARGASGGIARLLAIRLLGERKDAEAAPILAACAKDPDPFVRIYAEGARARVEGREPKVVVEEDPAFQKLLESLPEETTLLAVYRLPRGGPSMDILGRMTEMAKVMGGPSPEEMRREATEQVLELVRKIGNVRIDAAAFAVSGAPKEGEGSLTMLLGGIADPERIIAEVIRNDRGGSERRTIEGFPAVAEKTGEGVIVFPSDRVAVAGIEVRRFPSALPGILQRFKSGEGGLRGDDPMSQFAKGRAQAPGIHALLVRGRTFTQPLLAEARGGPPALKALEELDSAELEWKPGGDRTLIRLEGTFRKPAAANEFSDFLNEQLRTARKELKAQAGQVPEPMKPMLEKARKALDGIRIASSGAALTARAEYEELPLAELLFGAFMPFTMGVRF